MYNKQLGQLLISCGFLTLVLTGCDQQSDATSVPLANASPTEAAVTESVLARWQALINSDIEQAHAYLSPSSREMMPLERYKTRIKPGLWRDAEVHSLNCAENLCEVIVQVTFDIPGVQSGLTKNVQESWLKDQGNWWYVSLE